MLRLVRDPSPHYLWLMTLRESLSLTGTECTSLSQCNSESDCQCHRCCLWVFEAIAKLSYPVVAEIFLSSKFVFAGLRRVRNSDQTPCFCTVWKDLLNDGNEDVVLVVCTTRNTSAAALRWGGSSSSAMMRSTGNNCAVN